MKVPLNLCSLWDGQSGNGTEFGEKKRMNQASCVSVWRRWVHCGSAKHHTSGVSETTGNGKKPTGCYRVPRYDDKRHKGHGFWVASESRRCGNVWKQEAILHRDRKRAEKAQLVRGKDREPDNWIIKKGRVAWSNARMEGDASPVFRGCIRGCNRFLVSKWWLQTLK